VSQGSITKECKDNLLMTIFVNMYDRYVRQEISYYQNNVRKKQKAYIERIARTSKRIQRIHLKFSGVCSSTVP
jgi:hypothetical protein